MKKNNNISNLPKFDFCISLIFIKLTIKGCELTKNETIDVPLMGKVNNKMLYIKTIELDPNYAKAYFNLGNNINFF